MQLYGCWKCIKAAKLQAWVFCNKKYEFISWQTIMPNCTGFRIGEMAWYGFAVSSRRRPKCMYGRPGHACKSHLAPNRRTSRLQSKFAMHFEHIHTATSKWCRISYVNAGNSMTRIRIKHGVIDYSSLINSNRLNWPKMKCNRRLHSRLNLKIFTVHHSATNRGVGGWVSSFSIVCYVSGEAIHPSVWFKPR